MGQLNSPRPIGLLVRGRGRVRLRGVTACKGGRPAAEVPIDEKVPLEKGLSQRKGLHGAVSLEIVRFHPL